MYLLWKQICFLVLVDMRFKGVRVDLEKAQNIKQNLIKREET